MVGIYDDFAILAQATPEDQAAVTKLKTENITLPERVVLYTNCISNKEKDIKEPQMSLQNIQ